MKLSERHRLRQREKEIKTDRQRKQRQRENGFFIYINIPNNQSRHNKYICVMHKRTKRFLEELCS